MNPVIASGVVIGIIGFASTRSPGAAHVAMAGDAIIAAMQSLQGKMVAGVGFAVDSGASAITTYGNMRIALVAKYGAIGGISGASLPAGLTGDQLKEIMTAWLAAYDAGRLKNVKNFAMRIPSTGIGASVELPFTPCSSIDESDRTSLGSAACAMSSYRDNLVVWQSDDDNTVEAFRLIARLAGEMEGADYVAGGLDLRNSDQGWKLGDVPGALEAAASAVEHTVTDALGGVAGAIVGSGLFWLVGLGFVGYMVLR